MTNGGHKRHRTAKKTAERKRPGGLPTKGNGDQPKDQPSVTRDRAK